MKNFETLEVGKSYKSYRGEVVKIINKSSDPIFPFEGDLDSCYTVKGNYWSDNRQDERDLVELIEPTKTQTNLEPKTEKIQTEERKVRVFETLAIRSDNTGRERYDFISPLALKELAQFLATTENSFVQTNYYLGINEDACMESLLRHANDFRINGNKKEAVALLFNAVALVHTIALKERGEYIIRQEGTKLMPESEFMEIYKNKGAI